MRQVFNNGEYLLAEEAQQLQDEAVIVVANDTERNALPTNVKMCWQSGTLYKRSGGGTWEPMAIKANHPTLNGTGATGTWPISVSGNAGSVDGQHFGWSDPGTMPTYVWGGFANGDARLVSTNRFSQPGHTHDQMVFGGAAPGRTLAAGDNDLVIVYHGLGFAPSAVVANAFSDDSAHSIVTSLTGWDATGIGVQCRNLGNNAEAFDISWIAVR